MGDPKTDNSLGIPFSEDDSIVILSGAGVSMASGIPGYRDHSGESVPRSHFQRVLSAALKLGSA